jgi:hypothetical protein
MSLRIRSQIGAGLVAGGVNTISFSLPLLKAGIFSVFGHCHLSNSFAGCCNLHEDALRWKEVDVNDSKSSDGKSIWPDYILRDRSDQ